MSIFNRNKEQVVLTEHQKCRKKLKDANFNVLLVGIFSAVNLVMLLINSNTSFLFSGFLPQFSVLMGSEFASESGVYEYYVGGIVIAVAAIAVYFILYLIGRKNPGAIIASLVCFLLDTALLLFFVFVMIYKEYISDYIIDILFHVWIVYYGVSGTAAYFKLKKLPEQEPSEAFVEAPIGYTEKGESDNLQNVEAALEGKETQYKEPWE